MIGAAPASAMRRMAAATAVSSWATVSVIATVLPRAVRRSAMAVWRLAKDGVLGRGHAGQDQAGTSLAEGDDAGERRSGAQDILGRGDDAFRHGEGDDLYGGDHLAGGDALEGRQGGDGEPLVQRIDARDLVDVDHCQAGAGGEEVGPAGEGGGAYSAGATCNARDAVGCIVLADVVGFEAGRHDLGDIGRPQALDVSRGQDAPLFQGAARHLNGVGQNRAYRRRPRVSVRIS